MDTGRTAVLLKPAMQHALIDAVQEAEGKT